MSKKTVLSVDFLCSKCKKRVMKSIAAIEGINSIVLDPSKNTATVVGDADPAVILKKLRKCRRSAAFVSIGPAKEEKKGEKKKDDVPSLPKMCQRCDVWYVIGEDTVTVPFCNYSWMFAVKFKMRLFGGTRLIRLL